MLLAASPSCSAPWMSGLGRTPMSSRRRNRRSTRGGVLIVVLIMVMSIAAIAACIFQLDVARTRRVVASIDNKQAFNIAEAGLAEAYYGLTIGKTGAVASKAEPAGFGQGLFWVEATDLGYGVVGLQSTGMCGSGRATLALVVRRADESIASLGVLGGNQLSTGTRVQIDAYDSRTGVRNADGLRVQSNGSIVIGDNARINGDAAPGPDGSVILGMNARVTGSTVPNASTVDLPEIETPVIASQGSVRQLLGPRVLSGSEQAYESIVVGANATVVLEGPATVVIGTLSVSGLGTLAFDTTSGPVTLYVTDWLNLSNDSRLSYSSNNPADVSILVTATGSMDRDGDGVDDPAARVRCVPPYYGTLYAPLTTVVFPARFELFGTVSAAKLVIGADSRLHYDVALDAASDASTGGVKRLSWRVVEIPVEIAKSLSEDPFNILGVSEASLPAPVDAHADPGFQIHVAYIDTSGITRNYRGRESAFNWSLVRRVLAIQRKLL
jgi:Tfp pilus assembly protein PilX